MLILASETQIMHYQCLLHLLVVLPCPLPLVAQALTLTPTRQVLILLLIAAVLHLIPVIRQILHLTPSCSANRKPWWGATSLLFCVLWDVALIDRT